MKMVFTVLLIVLVKENKFCADFMKKHFNKELVMTKEGGEDFENSTLKLVALRQNFGILKT